MQRRRFIREEIERYGQVSFDQIRKKFPGTARSSIHQDIKHLQQLGDPIELEGAEDSLRKIVQTTRPRITTKKWREDQNAPNKDAIAELAAGIVWGLPNPPSNPSGLSVRMLKQNILNQLRAITEQHDGHLLVKTKAERVRNFLNSYWSKSHRSVGVDAGTTTERVAKFFTRLRMLDHAGDLNGLSVFTNSPAILDHFRDHSLDVAQHPTQIPTSMLEAIPIGGRLRLDTDAITGELSRKCLEGWQLHLDMSIIGTTDINFKDHLLRCDSEDEAQTKSIFLSRSSLRCIVADSSKFHRDTIFSSFPFATIADNFIDLIISDDDATKKNLQMCCDLGVLLINPSGIFKH